MSKTKWHWDEFTRAGTCDVCKIKGPHISLCLILSGVLRDLWTCLDCRNDKQVQDVDAIYRIIGGNA